MRRRVGFGCSALRRGFGLLAVIVEVWAAVGIMTSMVMVAQARMGRASVASD